MMAPDTMRPPYHGAYGGAGGSTQMISTICGSPVIKEELCDDGTRHYYTSVGDVYVFNSNGDVLGYYSNSHGKMMKFGKPVTPTSSPQVKEQYPKLDSYIDLRVMGK